MRLAPQTKLQDKPTQMSRTMSLPSQKRLNLTPIAAAKGELRPGPGPDCWAPSQNTRDHDAPWYCFLHPARVPVFTPNTGPRRSVGIIAHGPTGPLIWESSYIGVASWQKAESLWYMEYREPGKLQEKQRIKPSKLLKRSHLEWNGINSDGNPG